MHSYQKILVAIDFSEHSEEALARALDLAARYGAQLWLYHVTEAPLYPVLEDVALGGVGGVWDDNLATEMLHRSEKKLQSIAEGFGLEASQVLVEPGVPKSGVLEKAQELEVDLIVMGRHGLSGWQSLMGSTTQTVIAHAVCDVLAVSLDQEDQEDQEDIE